MSGPSAGPWTLGSTYNDTVMSADGGIVVDDPNLTDANARLIASAPELLAALKALMKDIDNGLLMRDISRDDRPGWSIDMMQFVARLQAAQRAILKAEEGR